MYLSYAKPRILPCPCGAKEETTSRNAKLCTRCILKRGLREPFGAALAKVKAA